MEFWIFLICVVALFLAYPYLRCFCKRLVCLYKLSRICKRKRFTLHGAHPLWFLGSKHARHCDCYIETPNQIFALKLFGMPRRLTVLIFRDGGGYVIRSFIAIMSFVCFTLHTKPKTMPVYDFRYRYREAWEIKTPHRILLIHPVSMEIRRQSRNGGERIVGAGDVVNGMEIYSLPRLLGTLENAI